MADAIPPLVFDTSFKAHPGQVVELLHGVSRITANNAGPYTLTGTNSFVIGHDRVAVLDPGPDDTTHRAALLAAIGGRPVEAILLTHTHRDHSAGALPLARSTGAPIWSGGPHRLSRPARLFEMNALARSCDWGLAPDRIFFDGERFVIGGVELTAIATPGHCANHFAYGVGDSGWLLSGDHVMGWNSTLVAVPDGSMADYLASLAKIIALPYRHYAPGHGGPIEDGPTYSRALAAHRELRNRQVVSAVNGGARTISDLLGRIYPTLQGKIRFAAGLTLKAHIEYLATRGEIIARRSLLGLRLRPAQSSSSAA